MFDFSIPEGVGYLATVVLMISFLFKNINTLRIVNTIGSVLFVIYGFLLATSWPIIISNAFISGVNVIYLTKHFRNN
jgi:hypothetical protein